MYLLASNSKWVNIYKKLITCQIWILYTTAPSLVSHVLPPILGFSHIASIQTFKPSHSVITTILDKNNILFLMNVVYCLRNSSVSYLIKVISASFYISSRGMTFWLSWLLAFGFSLDSGNSIRTYKWVLTKLVNEVHQATQMCLKGDEAVSN